MSISKAAVRGTALALAATASLLLIPTAPASATPNPTSTTKTDALKADLAALAGTTPIPAARAFAELEAGKATAKSAGLAAEGDCRSVVLKSGNFYVSAEFGWDGHGGAMLRARSQTIGPWEQFGLCTYEGYYVLSPLGNEPIDKVLYVSTEKDYTGSDYGMLRARAETIGTWEQYTIASAGAGLISLKARANNQYVTVERQWTGDRFGMLRARTGSVGPWEKFVLG